MKIYVVTEISFEYNDEYYYQGESDGGTPVKAFSTKEKANEAIPEYTRNWIKETSESKWSSIMEYFGEDAEDSFDIEQFASDSGLDEDEVREAFENYNTDKINKMVLDNLDAAVKALNLTLFKITEVEYDEAALAR